MVEGKGRKATGISRRNILTLLRYLGTQGTYKGGSIQGVGWICQHSCIDTNSHTNSHIGADRFALASA